MAAEMGGGPSAPQPDGPSHRHMKGLTDKPPHSAPCMVPINGAEPQLSLGGAVFIETKDGGDRESQPPRKGAQPSQPPELGVPKLWGLGCGWGGPQNHPVPNPTPCPEGGGAGVWPGAWSAGCGLSGVMGPGLRGVVGPGSGGGLVSHSSFLSRGPSCAAWGGWFRGVRSPPVPAARLPGGGGCFGADLGVFGGHLLYLQCC